MVPYVTQPNLFEATLGPADAEVATARQRMQEMIERLAGMDTPPWTDQMGVILDDGTFRRAMRLVPPAEAESLWTKFDAHMERLYAIWAAAQPAPSA